MDSAATNAVPSMTRPSPIKVFRSDRACLRTSGSAPPRIERKLNIRLTADLTFLIGDTSTKRVVLVNLQIISLTCTDGTPGRMRPRGYRTGQLQHQENIHAHRKVSPWVQGLRIMASADRQSRGTPLRAGQQWKSTLRARRQPASQSTSNCHEKPYDAQTIIFLNISIARPYNGSTLYLTIIDDFMSFYVTPIVIIVHDGRPHWRPS